MAGRSRRGRREARDGASVRRRAAAAGGAPALETGRLAVASGGLPGRLLAGVGLLALLPRLVVLAQLHDHPLLQPEGALDSAVYVRLARRAAAGDWALGPDVYYVSPLYIYFLAVLFRLFGPGLLVPKVVQVTLGAAAAALLAATGATLFGRRAGAVAGVLAALTGLLAFNEVLLLQSSLDPFLAALGLLLLARALTRDGGGSVRSWLAAGLAFGALSANRPNTLLAVAALALGHVALRLSGRAAAHSLALLLGLCAATAPFVLRNRLVAGEWVWLTSHGGLNFYIGNHAEADGRYRSIEGIEPSIEGQARSARAVAEAAAGRSLSAAGVSDQFYARAFDWIRTSPWQASRLLARKVLLALNSTDLALNYSYTYYRLDEPTLLRWTFVGPGLLVPLGLLGMAVTPPERRAQAFASWRIFVPAYALSVALFFVASRYRLPLFVALCVTSGAALVRFVDFAREGRTRALRACALALAALLALTLWPLAPDEGRANERTERIVAWVMAGRADAASGLLADAEKWHPAPGLLFYRVGRAFQDRGELREAVSWFERALPAAAPGAGPVVDMSLGQALAAVGRAAEAIPHLAAARDAGVSPALAAYELTLALAAAGRDEEARAEVRKLRFPAEAPAGPRVAVAQVAWRLGENETAIAIVREAVRLFPDDQAVRELLQGLEQRR